MNTIIQRALFQFRKKTISIVNKGHVHKPFQQSGSHMLVLISTQISTKPQLIITY